MHLSLLVPRNETILVDLCHYKSVTAGCSVRSPMCELGNLSACYGMIFLGHPAFYYVVIVSENDTIYRYICGIAFNHTSLRLWILNK